jgi:hypothetical protein
MGTTEEIEDTTSASAISRALWDIWDEEVDSYPNYYDQYQGHYPDHLTFPN